MRARDAGKTSDTPHTCSPGCGLVIPMRLLFSLVLLAICCSYTSGLVTLPASRYSVQSADLGLYYVEILVGRPKQVIRAQVDTGSGYVVVPGTRQDCPECSVSSGNSYDRSLSNTVRIVPCHSRECLHVEGTDSAHGVPTICVLEIGDTKVCPKPDAATQGEVGAFGGGMAPEGVGQCLLDPSITPGPAVACNDHLEVTSKNGDPLNGADACAVVLHMGYTCETLMATFEPDLKGKLTDVCSETCEQCSEGPVRFCDDNQAWMDADGDGCEAYRSGEGKHDGCFEGDGQANFACPIACGSCGDCCASPAASASTSDELECYFFMQYVDGTSVSGSKVKELIDLQLEPSTTAMYDVRFVAPVDNVAVGVFNHVDSRWEASEAVDGVLGMSSGVACNPSCEPSFLDAFWRANPWLPKQFALCLSTAPNTDGSGAVDLGGVVAEHYQEPLVWLGLLLERQLMGDMGYTINSIMNPLIDVQIGGISNVHESRPMKEESVWSTSAELAGYAVAVDSGVTGVLLPSRLFAAVAALFVKITPTFNAQNPLYGKRNTSLLWPNTGRLDSVCGGPVTADYVQSADFHPIRLVFSGDVDGLNFTIELGPSDYLIKNPNPEVSRIQLPNGAQNTLELQDGQQYLCNSIGVSPKLHGRREKIVLGGAFLQRYYTTFDLERDRIGFATATNCEHPGPVPPPPCEVPTILHGNLGSCPLSDTGEAVAESNASGWLPGGAFCEINCDDGYHAAGQLAAATSSSTSGPVTAARQSYAEAPQFVICGMDGQLIGLTRCDPNGEACISAPCNNGGICIEHETNHYECRCPDAYTGANCEVTKESGPALAPAPPSCARKPCGPNTEICVPLPGGRHSCTCKEGWEGNNCEQPTSSTRPPVDGGSNDPTDGTSTESPRTRGSMHSSFTIKSILLIGAGLACAANCWKHYHEGTDLDQQRGGHNKGGVYQLVPQRDDHVA